MASDGLDLDGVEDAYPLTAAQAGMLYHTLSAPSSGTYIGCIDAALPASLEIDVFKAAWSTVLQRHQALRTVFVWEGLDAPVQVVLEKSNLKWEEYRWPASTEEQNALLDETQQGGVELTAAPATRLCVFQGGDGHTHFAWLFHHALVDDWSAATVLGEVARTYKELMDGSSAELDVSMPFREFVDWTSGADTDAAKGYWLRILGDYEDAVTLQLPAPEPTAASTHNPGTLGTHKFELDEAATSLLQTHARALRVTPNAILNVLWGVILHRLSGQDDVTFGLAVTLRPPELQGVETAVGNFVTTLPTRVTIDATDSLRALLTRSHEALLEARQHATLSLRDIRELTALPTHSPFLETILSVKTRSKSFSNAEELFSAINVRDRSNFSLALIISLEERLHGTILFDMQRYTSEQVDAISDMVKQAVLSFGDGLDAPPTALAVLDATTEKAATASISGQDLPPHALVLEEILRHTRLTPDKPALVCGDQTLTYAELGDLSGRWAEALADAGILPGSRVAVYAERDPHAIVGMLAALRAGCCYVPVNAAQQTQRTQDILDACNAAAILTRTEYVEFLPSSDVPLFLFDQSPPESSGETRQLPSPSDAAYVIFTSGSTGKPKGVVVSHANLAASTAARAVFYPNDPTAFLLLSSIEFDSSVVGIYWTLTTGGTLVMPPIGEEQDVAALSRAIETHQITDLLCLPSLLELLFTYAPSGSLASLRTAISAGEELMESCHAAWQEHAPHVRMYNEYGPTEATVWCVACEVDPQQLTRRLPIGQPIPGSHHYIRDAHRRPVPHGLPGELWVGGPGVAQSYLENPDLTESKFVPDPIKPGGRVYCTGDLVRLRPDGALDYLGRVDHQVKIRGHRVELGEIEAVLLARPEINSAAVTHFCSVKEKQLAAFLVLEHHSDLSVDTLRDSLRVTLPDWMIPQRFITLSEMPKTVTGKIDRNALIVPADQDGDDIVAPRTQLEKELAGIWKDILWLDRHVGVHEEFADLGGHSLLSIRLVNEIETQLGKKLPLTQIGRLTTIAEQAKQIEYEAVEQNETHPDPAPLITSSSHLFQKLDTDQLKQMHAFMAGWPGTPVWEGSMYRGLNMGGSLPPLFWCFTWGKQFAAMAEALGPDQPLYGTRSGQLVIDSGPELHQWDNRRVAMSSVEEVLKIQPEGAFYIGGVCQGAAIAMETAQVLQGLAKPVGLVIMMEEYTKHAFHGDVALIFGAGSFMNPYSNNQNPEPVWDKQYSSYTVDTIDCDYGQYWRTRNIKKLAHVITTRLAEARKKQNTPAYVTPFPEDETQPSFPAIQDQKIDSAIAALLFQARELADNGMLREAAEILGTARSLQPDHFETLKLLGILYAENGEVNRAEKTIRRALKQREDPVLRVHLAKTVKLAKQNGRWRYKLRSGLWRLTRQF